MDLSEVLDAISQSADGVVAIGPDQRIIAWNRAAEDLFGRAANDALGRLCYEVVDGIDPSGNLFCFHGCSPMVCIARGGLVRSFDVQAVGAAGHRRRLSASVIVLRDANGQLRAMVHLFRPAVASAPSEEVLDEVMRRLFPNGGPTVERSLPAVEFAHLTPREREILQLLCGGASTTDVAEHLCIATKTARNHIERILRKLGVHSRLEAVTLVTRGDHAHERGSERRD